MLVNIAELVLEKLRHLPEDRQRKVLDFVEREIEATETVRGPLFDLYGLWAGEGLDITEDDIAQARREMWGKVPREDI
jgi:hypothetical protein